MKVRKLSPIVLIFLSVLLMTSCLLPGMIPLNSEPRGPMPVMEENSDTVLEMLQSGDWHYLQALAKEQYTDEDYARPGTLTYTAKVTDDLPVYFVYGWCAVDEETLRQNFEHIEVRLSVNGEELGNEVVHNLTYTSPDGLQCLDFGALITEWPDGTYQLEAVATFDEEINDGLADYKAGDYVFKYQVEVKKAEEGG